MGAAAGDQRGEVFEEHHRVVGGLAGVVAEAKGAEGRGGGGADRAVAGGLGVEGEVVQDGEAVVGVEDEVDLDAGARGHALEDAPAGEDRVGGAAAGAVPFQIGAVAVVEE